MEKLADLVISALTDIQDNWKYWPLPKEEFNRFVVFFLFFSSGPFTLATEIAHEFIPGPYMLMTSLSF